jgi:hypothetical protein
MLHFLAVPVFLYILYYIFRKDTNNSLRQKVENLKVNKMRLTSWSGKSIGGTHVAGSY